MVTYSVIMPIYNVEDHLRRAINSVIEQTFTDWELILVNDGSTDKSGKIANEFANNSNKITLINQQNMGSGIARQNGLNIAKGQYICFIDPDDYINKMALENNFQIIEDFKPDVVVNGYKEYINDFAKGETSRTFIPILNGFYEQHEFRNNFDAYEQVGSRVLWNKLYRKDFLSDSEIKFTNQRVGQDALFNIEVYKNIMSIFISSDVYYNYDNTRKNSATKAYNPERKQFEMNIAKQYNKLITSWGQEQKYLKNISLNYWSVVTKELINLMNNNSSISFSDKITILKDLLVEEEISHSIENLNINDLQAPFSKIFFFLINKKMYRTVLLTAKLYKKIRH